MVEVRLEQTPEIKILGRKIWISGTDNELFGQFWKESHENGLVASLKNLLKDKPDRILNSDVFGVSCVEKDPNNRSFYFFIAAEGDTCPEGTELEEYRIPACEWAVFRNKGEMPRSLFEAEMYAFMEWLPRSGYLHANAPELELYPGSDLAEFWLPVIK